MGRPSNYSKKIADVICTRIAEGESLRKICSDDEMPCRGAVQNWLEKNEPFVIQYARAHKMRAQLHAEEIVELVDAPLTVRDAKGKLIPKADRLAFMRMQIEQRRQQVDARKWSSAKGDPKKYGEIKSVEAEDSDVIIHGGLPEPNQEQGK